MTIIYYDQIEDSLCIYFNDGGHVNSNKNVKTELIIENFTKKVDDKSKGKLSDGYHTFDELYYHRMILFSVICNQNRDLAWKSWLHADGTMYQDYFIVGIATPDGDYTYHFHKDYWNKFQVPELERGHTWDGHKPEDIERLCSLLR